METQARRKTHLVMLPSAGIGHLFPAMELARRLCEDHQVTVTVLTSPWMYPPDRISAFVERAAKLCLDMRFVSMPDVALTAQEIKDVISLEARLTLLLHKTKPHVKTALESVGTAEAFLTDFFCSEMLETAAERGLPAYLFFVSAASFCSFMLNAPRLLRAEYSGSFHKDPDLRFRVPGLRVPVAGRDMPTSVQVRDDETFTVFMKHCTRLAESPYLSGILVNTFAALEGSSLTAAGEMLRGRPVCGVGPVVGRDQKKTHLCLGWLDQQPPRSVVYISFGSGKTVSDGQARELAEGLEASGQRFLWVLKRSAPPPEHREGKGFAVSALEAEPAEVLPDGFVERTQGRGLVVTTWVPQVEVLQHPATGGFMSHCGWNSCLESIVGGVPVIPWPMFAEQAFNRHLLLQEFAIGVDLERGDDGFVPAKSVERALKELMEGERGDLARRNVTRLCRLAEASVGKGGDSWQALAEIVCRWRKAQRRCDG
eukprot:TRINITY_DN8835_c1_g1_i1.p1 TRINITY_DN8835_c1_g1~~TRINITY_DN8835_c1_g1_i1.p1  ORF type:complete len:484 (+),score=-25.48 TRINITY_DN8835_c1_g1_i1:124-1575(+)